MDNAYKILKYFHSILKNIIYLKQNKSNYFVNGVNFVTLNIILFNIIHTHIMVIIITIIL